MLGSSWEWACRGSGGVPGTLPGADRVGYSSRAVAGCSAYRLPAAPPPRRPESVPGASLSVIRPKPPQDPIGYHPPAAGSDTPAPGGAAALAARLEAARAELTATADDRRRSAGGDLATPATTLVDLPDRLLDDYGRDRPSSELFAILRAARRIRDAVDRVVLGGEAGVVLAVRALFESCCHPFHNDLPRGERGGRPRLAFEGFAIDNDSTQGLLDLVAPAGRPPGADLLDRWALIAVGAATRETALATRLLLAALAGPEADRCRLADLVVPISAPGDRLAAVAGALGCADAFAIPPGAAGVCAPFSAAGLLPAAIVGMDVVRLLEGAAAMNRRFREAPVGANPVLDHAARSHLAGAAGLRVLSVPSCRLETLGWWHARLLAETLGVATLVATPLTDLVAAAAGRAGRPAGADRPDVLVTRIVVGEPRRDRLVLPAPGAFAHEEDPFDAPAGVSWPELQAAAGARDGTPSEERIVLPRIDEHAIGQLLQMLMLSARVEGRLRV